MKVCIHNCKTDEYLAGDGTWSAQALAALFDRVADAVAFCGDREQGDLEIVITFGKKEEVHIPLHQTDC